MLLFCSCYINIFQNDTVCILLINSFYSKSINVFKRSFEFHRKESVVLVVLYFLEKIIRSSKKTHRHISALLLRLYTFILYLSRVKEKTNFEHYFLQL